MARAKTNEVITQLMNEIAMLKERVAKIECTARAARGPRTLGVDVEARKRYFAANPGARAASRQDVESWLRTTGAL
jgi:hypothetical protein